MDDKPPVLAGVPDGITLEAANAHGAAAQFSPIALDDVDGEVPVSCTPPAGAVLPLGTTEITCVAADSSGNKASASFDVLIQDVLPPDTTPPETQIQTGPAPGGTVGPAVSFTYAGTPDADLDHFECRLGTAAFADCPLAGRAYSALPSGAHSFEVRAVDASGNADESPASRSFVVDADPPETKMDSGPSGTITDTSPSFTFSSEPGAVFQCRLDGAGFTACTSPRAYSDLAQGSHLFEVRALDALGNTDPTPAGRSFAIAANDGSSPPDEPSPPAGSGAGSPPPPAPAGSPKPHRLKCRKGFRKKVVHGKARCVKAKKPRKKHTKGR